MRMRDLAGLANYSYDCYQSGNLQLAEHTARLLLKEDADYLPAHILLGLIAMNVGMLDIAIKGFKQAIRLSPDNREARQYLALAKKKKSRTRPDKAATHTARSAGICLIKSWGYGLWSDMDHVLGQLLLAEISGRIPVVHWGSNSLFRATGNDNAFTQFFEPVSARTINDITDQGFSYYPPKWTDENLSLEDINKWDGPYSRITALYSLNRAEDVTVSDFYTYLVDLLPWIPEQHEYHGMGAQDVYRRIYRKYIRPRPEILSAVEDYWTAHIRDRHVLAVHVRGSDKIIEIPNLHELNKSCHDLVNNYLDRHPDTYIYLLSDSGEILSDYRNRYGDKLMYSDCKRTTSDQGIHLQAGNDRQRIGSEVIVDACLAAKCDYFIGVGHSNVSTSILHMKDWAPSAYHLIGENLLFRTNFGMHKR